VSLTADVVLLVDVAIPVAAVDVALLVEVAIPVDVALPVDAIQSIASGIASCHLGYRRIGLVIVDTFLRLIALDD